MAGKPYALSFTWSSDDRFSTHLSALPVSVIGSLILPFHRRTVVKYFRNCCKMSPKWPSSPPDTYKFGAFALDAETGALFCGGAPTVLGQRGAALLRLLLERAASPVSKDALIEAAWAGLNVEESNLTVQIAALRRALEQDGG